MDNFTHSLAGWALGQAGLKRRSRKGLAALVLGANAPDIDVFFGWAPWAPLATHRGVTHSLVAGLWVMPILTAGFLWLLDRWQVRRGETFGSGLEMRPGWLMALAFIGCLTHPLLDWQTTYSVQLLSPFSNLWFHNDSLFIVDVWIWTGLSLAVWLSRRRERRGVETWRRPPAIALGALVAYIAANGAYSAAVKSGFGERGTEAIYASPAVAAFWRREVAVRAADRMTWTAVDPLGSTRRLAGPLPDGMDDPIVRQALRSPQARSFAHWSTMPFASVERGRCEVRVRFGDARYGRDTRTGRLGASVTLPVRGGGCR